MEKNKITIVIFIYKPWHDTFKKDEDTRIRTRVEVRVPFKNNPFEVSKDLLRLDSFEDILHKFGFSFASLRGDFRGEGTRIFGIGDLIPFLEFNHERLSTQYEIEQYEKGINKSYLERENVIYYSDLD